MSNQDKPSTPNNTRLIAHRGGSSGSIENSLSAFRACVDMGYKYLETDVILSSDGKVLSYHGSQNAYMRNKTGLEKRKKIQKLTYNEINSRLYDNKIEAPLLEDLLSQFPDCYFSVDAKTWEVVDPLVDIIKKTKSQNRVSITSFNIRRSRIIAKKLGDSEKLETGLCLYRITAYPLIIFSELFMKYFSKNKIRCLHVPFSCVTKGVLRASRRHGILIYAWSVNDEREIKRLLSIGVDGIISDDIMLLKETAQMN